MPKNLLRKKCEICKVILNEDEERDSEKIIGGDRYFCTEHLNQKMDW